VVDGVTRISASLMGNAGKARVEWAKQALDGWDRQKHKKAANPALFEGVFHSNAASFVACFGVAAVLP
jgi:hypothetical protein